MFKKEKKIDSQNVQLKLTKGKRGVEDKSRQKNKDRDDSNEYGRY